MKTFNLLLIFHLLIGSGLPILGQVYVSDGEDLQDAVNAANPGDEFIVPNGSYHDFEASFTAVATKEAPIIVRAETIGGVTLTGESHFTFKKAAHIILQGFIIDGQGENTLVKLEGSHHIRISRNVFELETNEPIKWVYIGGVWDDHTFQYLSHHNRVDYNTFQNKATPGHYITIDGTYNEDDTDIRQSQYDRIDHNYFRNNSPRAANEQESIRIGWSEMSQASGYTTVEFNLFEDCDGDPEVISVKSCDNLIRHNTFRKSYGTLSLRHGNRNRVEGNYFFGDGKANGTFSHSNGNTQTLYTGGIRIYGTDHVIVNNYMEGLQGTVWDAPIALTQGDAIEGSSTNYSKHFRAERITIAYNTLVNNAHGIEIGYDKNGDYSKGLKDIFISNNLITGSENSLISYLNGNTQGDEIKWYNNIFFPTGNATLTSDGSGFDTSEANILDPMLAFDGMIWQATSSSPLLDRGMASLDILEDIDGQVRPALSTVGADHYSMESVRFAPLTPQDVGPQSIVTTPIEAGRISSIPIHIYPNPNSGFFTLSQVPVGKSKIRIFTVAGKILVEQDLSGRYDRDHTISLPHLPNGYYFLQLSVNGQSEVKKMVIRK
ncbi:MAG: chondroitinase-B domain-containing protein [Bacteroidota bacterium]